VRASAFHGSVGVREHWLVDFRTHPYSLSGEGTYEMTGQYVPGEAVASVVLSDLALPVDGLFVG